MTSGQLGHYYVILTRSAPGNGEPQTLPLLHRVVDLAQNRRARRAAAAKARRKGQRP